MAASKAIFAVASMSPFEGDDVSSNANTPACLFSSITKNWERIASRPDDTLSTFLVTSSNEEGERYESPFCGVVSVTSSRRMFASVSASCEGEGGRLANMVAATVSMHNHRVCERDARHSVVERDAQALK